MVYTLSFLTGFVFGASIGINLYKRASAWVKVMEEKHQIKQVAERMAAFKKGQFCEDQDVTDPDQYFKFI